MQSITRRQFTGHLVRGAGLVVMSSAALSLDGCSVWTDIVNWIPVGEAAVNSILSLLTANGVLIAAPIQVIVSLIEAGFTALKGAVQEYQSTTPPPVGALAKVEAGFKAVIDNFTTFVQSLGVSGGLLGIITGLAQIIFGTLAAFMNKLPASSSLRRTVVIGSTVKVGTATVAVNPKMRTRRVFKKDWNATMATSPRVGVTCPPSAYLPVSFWEKL